MKLDGYKQILSDILCQDGGVVVLLNGAWGVGKTHFWDEFAKSLNEKRCAYVSLFGKNDIAEIKSDALIQVFPRNKYIDGSKKILDQIKSAFNLGDKSSGSVSFGLTGSMIGMFLSLLRSDELNNAIVCIDDFERKGEKLSCIEIMGFATILSERYACKVVLIMDENVVTRGTEKEKYLEYKEKAIDFEIHFSPQQEELVESMSLAAHQAYRGGLVSAIKFLGESNLRNIRKAVRLVDILERKAGSRLNDWARDILGYNMLILCHVYFGLGKNGLEYISDLQLSEKLKDKIFPEKVKCYAERVAHRVSTYSSVDCALWDFIEKNDLNIDLVSTELLKSEATAKLKDVKECIYGLLDRFTDDYFYSKEDYVRDMCAILNDNETIILDILPLDTFVYVVDSVAMSSDVPEAHEKYKQGVINAFISGKVNKIKTLSDFTNFKQNTAVEAIFNSDPGLKKDFEQVICELEQKLMAPSNIMEIMDRVRSSGGWSQIDESAINSLSKELLKESIETMPGFLKAIVAFLRWRRDFIAPQPFSPFATTAINLLKEMGEAGLGLFRYRRISTIVGIQ